MKLRTLLMLLCTMPHCPATNADGDLRHTKSTENADQPEGIELTLSLRSPTEEFSLSATIDVIVNILNTGTSYWVIPPGIVATSDEQLPQPWMELDFLILDEHGKEVKYIGNSSRPKRRILPPSSFLVLLPDYFYGRKVSLNREPFFYELTHPGRYQITAHLKISARRWLDYLGREEGLGTETLPYDIERVLDGELRSQVVEITVH